MDTFTITKRVYYHDTDCGGVVYYANYLKYLEEARTEHFRSKGIDLGVLSRKDGILFAVADLEIRYKSPARYGDELIVTSAVEKMKAASFHFYQEIKRGDAVLVACKTRLVTIGENFKPAAIPDNIAKLFAT